LCRQNCDRVAAKFVENEFEKADRLMELFFQYQQTFKNGLERIKQREDLEKDEIDIELRDAGQFMVQQVSLVPSVVLSEQCCLLYDWKFSDLQLSSTRLSCIE
jgi:beta-catenin-like protein 1